MYVCNSNVFIISERTQTRIDEITIYMYILATDQVISRRLNIVHFISSFCLFLKTYMLEKKEAGIH